MKKPEMRTQAGGNSGAAVKVILADQPCPNAFLCRRYSSDDGGAWCRLCWRDYTHPQPVRIAQGRT